MTDHTGPNTGPGGCHGGLSSRRYHRLLRTGVVAIAPIPAVPATAPTIRAASRRVSPGGRDSAADALATHLTLPLSRPSAPGPLPFCAAGGRPGRRLCVTRWHRSPNQLRAPTQSERSSRRGDKALGHRVSDPADRQEPRHAKVRVEEELDARALPVLQAPREVEFAEMDRS
jgi:hypothetical protein